MILKSCFKGFHNGFRNKAKTKVMESTPNAYLNDEAASEFTAILKTV